ncbi:DedA family protein [Timonella sp. A28]|uniref:DedA family protein n=1 Tax=Timonella sp. A28 TaxID=3442640 RepID=UPI003EB7B75A
MPDALDDAPVFVLFVFFFSIAFLRTQATYWLARYVAYRTMRSSDFKNPTMGRIAHWINTNAQGSGINAVHRWGALAVFGSFFMSGTKTVINLAAGLTRMKFPVWLAAMTAGCVAHGIIYATIGWAAWLAALSAAAGSPLGLAIVVLFIGAVVWTILRTRKKLRLENNDHTHTQENNLLG